MNVMVVALGIAVAGFVFFFLWTELAEMWPAGMALGTAAVFALAIICMAVVYA
ncbi:hypothetical protein [Corynebacterium glutamicum]|uniref:hypothetical protein n=1 Tax=Corynebacterium glutamicum TaxID=1718 RepID=UPI00031A17A5|nr:hypothetical protein [Corynebacterium glutamicum]